MPDDILDIARSWSFWDRPIPPSVPRQVDWPAELRPSLALVVQGVRRCGKSTLLQQLVEHYGIPRERALFLNMEDPRLIGALDHRTLTAAVDGFTALHHDDEPLLFLLDEIQHVQGWERWLRARLDRPGRCRFVVTGSNASLLSGELGSTLTGRHLPIELFPFDLAERQQADPSVTLERLLHEGGFPEPLQTPDADRLLRQYFLDIVERDVRERVGARSIRPLRQVVHMVFESMGGELSLRRLAAAAGVATDTVGTYLSACQDAYLLFSVSFFAWSERRRAHHPRKYYPVDTGLRRVVVTHTGPDRGKALESAVHLVLRRRYGQVSYWRGQGEVDFVLQQGRRILPVQVSWDGAIPRHERALDSFYEAFPTAEEALYVSATSFARLSVELEQRLGST